MYWVGPSDPQIATVNNHCSCTLSCQAGVLCPLFLVKGLIILLAFYFQTFNLVIASMRLSIYDQTLSLMHKNQLNLWKDPFAVCQFIVLLVQKAHSLHYFSYFYGNRFLIYFFILRTFKTFITFHVTLKITIVGFNIFNNV